VEDTDFGYVRANAVQSLHEFKLHRQEKFLCVCISLHIWE